MSNIEEKTVQLLDGIMLRFNVLKELSGNEIKAYEIFKDKEFQDCFIGYDRVEDFKSRLQTQKISFNEFQTELTKIAENTIKLAKNILE